MMSYVAPGCLTDEEAQQIAAFISAQPRPAYPFKDQDYVTEPQPVGVLRTSFRAGRADRLYSLGQQGRRDVGP